MLLGVDVGGTFTDAVLIADGRIWTGKAPSTPEDQSEGVLDAVGQVLERAGEEARGVEAFAHGTTVATNALLEGRGARTALVATEGFTDVVELGRQNRADLYRLCAAHPAPLVPPERRVGAPERMGPDGVLQELDERAAREIAKRVSELEPESVAVCLLHADRHPEHEAKLGEALRRALPDVHVSLSHEVVGTFREFERAATTELDAALSPLLGAYLRRLVGRAREAGLPTPSLMQSSGGLTSAEEAASHAALTLLSGPAGGAAGAAWAARAADEPDALCFDMGGTSCDVCVISGGAVRESAGRSVGGRPVALPMLDLHTVGAGGGSIAWRDAGGALRVGPQSAGARPGPACYGHGGTEPTVTDANLLLGLLDPEAQLAGGLTLDRGAAERAVGDLAERLELEPLACARGIVRVANAEMVRALRVMTVERGVDPRDYALLAFGGAGPLHAAAMADELGMRTVLCPRASGVLAALGLIVSERRHDVQRSLLVRGEQLTGQLLRDAIAELAQRAREGLGMDATVRVVADLRYRGQAFELSVATSEQPVPDELREAFATAHEQAYGFADPDGEVELVTLRVSAIVPGPEVSADAPPGRGTQESQRTAVFGDDDPALCPVVSGEPEPGSELDGPAILALPESTVAVPPGWHASVDRAGTVRLERSR